MDPRQPFREELPPVNDIPATSIFRDQWRELTDLQKHRRTRNATLALHSLLRRRTHQITTKTLSTQGDFIVSHRGTFRIALSRPHELLSNTSDPLNRVPECIQCILARRLTHPTTPLTTIGGIPAHEVIYHPTEGAPIWEASLERYDSDIGILWYRISQLVSLDDGRFGSDPDDPLCLKWVLEVEPGYREANHFRIPLDRMYRNVTQIRLLSSEFPTPSLPPIHGRSPSYHFTLQSEGSRGLTSSSLLERTIHLDRDACDTYTDIYTELARSLRHSLRDLDMHPYLSRDRNPSLSLLRLEIPENRFQTIRRVGNEWIVGLTGHWSFTEGELLYVQASHDKNLGCGFYRTMEMETLQLDIRINGTGDETPPLYATLYREKTPVGYLLSHTTSRMIVITDNKAAFIEGERLHFGEHNMVVEISSVADIGPSPVLVISEVGEAETLEKCKQPGLYRMCPFRMRYPSHSILHRVHFSNAADTTTTKYARSQSYQVQANLKLKPDHTSQLRFFTQELPQSRDGYDIIALQNPEMHRKQYGHREVYTVIAVDDDLRIYLRESTDDVSGLHAGQWVQVIMETQFPRYRQIHSVEISPRSQMTVSLAVDQEEWRLDGSLDSITHLVVFGGDMTINRSPFGSEIEGQIVEPLLRGSKIIQTVGEYHPGFIVQIGSHRDGHRGTTAELNILEASTRVEDADGDEIIRWKLMHPISNSRLVGTPVRQLFLHVKLDTAVRAGGTTLDVISPHLDLSGVRECRGCINWLSLYLSEDSAGEFVEEEPICITTVKPITIPSPPASSRRSRRSGSRQESSSEEDEPPTLFRLHLRYPISHSYRPRETYLVLFIHPDGTRSDPSSVNICEGGTWYTGLALTDSMHASRESTVAKAVFTGARGDAIPVYGLSASDHATRSMKGLDIGSDMELVSDLITIPAGAVDIVHAYPNAISRYMGDTPFIVIQGRHSAREGNLRLLEPGELLYTDVFRSQIQGVTDEDGDVIETNFSSDFLPKRLALQKDTTVQLTVRPRTEEATMEETFTYFYVCCPFLGTFQLGNRSLDPYPALDGWAFGTGDQPVLESRTEMLAEYKQLHTAFAKIQLDGGPTATSPSATHDKILWNTFVPTVTDLSNQPLQTLDSLELTCLWPNGQLVDFGGKEYSMTLEIQEEVGTLHHLDARTGRCE